MQTPKKPADFGKAIGINKPANVRDKIKKWQAELEGEEPSPESIEKPEAAAAAATPTPTPDDAANAVPSPKPQPSTPKANPVDAVPSPKPTHTPSKSVDNLPERPKSAKKAAAHNKLDEEVVIATAPKKRVISDSHWRTNKSPPKDGTNRPSPKALPNAWVRPAARKVDSSENKPATPAKPEKVQVKITSKTPAQRARNANQRRPSQPASSGNEERPASSGSGSATAPKREEGVLSPPESPPLSPGKIESELVRIRRRRRTETSPRSSMSAEDAALARIEARRKSTGDYRANLITVEYAPSSVGSARDEEIRARRRRRPRRERIVSPEDTPKEPISPREPKSTGRRRSRRSSPRQSKENILEKSPEPATAGTPTKVFGTRLEAWLSTTPDPFVDAESSCTRRTSKESVSTLELSQKPEKSEVSASTEAKEEPVEEAPPRKRSRRRRRRSPKLEVETQIPDEPSTVVSSVVSTVVSTTVSTEPSEVPSSIKEEAIPSPTLTLRRRGARRATHSPTKSRDVSSTQPESIVSIDDTVSSAPSSSVEPSSMAIEKVPQRPNSDALAMRRIYPSTRGKRLSTIASVETFATKKQAAPLSEAMGSEITDSAWEPASTISEVPESESRDQFDSDKMTMLSRKSTRRSRMASHADLISVLSMPRAGTRSIVSARSIRTNRSRLATATISDIMNELASDETKYMRELRTLVDGVIPVLLSCVLSKSDSAVAAGLFSRSAKADPSTITKPIIDMGVSLERLKSLHRRVPKDSSEAFLSWSHSAQRVYSEYISVWRLGFEDVVVSLAPADEDPFTQAKVVQGPEDAAPWDEGLPRNAEGYVVNGNGERVDVAYMLKRPLVRLKYLSKTLKGINHVKPSEQAEKISNDFQDLVNAARKRSNDERARLEDEAAASIDPTRARDPRSLAPLAGVRIDPTRCVRARDYFDLHLLHSSGQEVNCRVELLLRDDAPGTGKSGDVLICEVDGTGRWLFLPPIQLSRISSRNGDLQGEIIVMIRGHHADSSEWSEVFSLKTDDEQAGFDWVQMLGLQPIPPQLSELKREESIVHKSPRPGSSHASSSEVSGATGSTLPQKSRSPSPHEIEIPIGEQANPTSKKWGYETPDRLSRSREISPITPPSAEQTTLQKARATTSVSPLSRVESRQSNEEDAQTPRPTSRRSGDENERTPRGPRGPRSMSGTGSPLSLRRTRAKRLSKNSAPSPTSSSRPSRQIVLDDPIEEEEAPPRKNSHKRRSEPPPSTTASTLSQSSKGFSVWMPTSDVDFSDESDESDNDYEEVRIAKGREESTRPNDHRRVSSVPSLDLPSIPRLRKTSQPVTPVKQTAEEDPVKMIEPSASAPPKLERHAIEAAEEDFETEEEEDKPPPVPPHRSPSPATPVTLKGSTTPVLTPGMNTKRRSSSPLKHEYEPSTCTELSSESEDEVSEDELSETSESSEDELDDDVPMPLMPIGQPKQFPQATPPSSIYNLPNGTITPSQSASNTPYRQVPSGSGKAVKAVASIYSWSDAGKWESLHPEECSIVVTPGKIEVFEITSVHSKPFLADGDEIFQPEGMAPLVAVELTPLVPMRKSTGLDITIRSPPTPDSRVKSGNNIMLRSRNPAECSQLYAMINHSRINNPTYIALQQARGPYGQSSWAEAMDRQNAARANAGSSGGWLSGTLGRRSSYRKTTTRAASVSAATESSVGTMNTALRSALGRFRFGANGRFSIRNSTLGSRSINSTDSGSMGSGSGTSTPQGDSVRAPGAPAGITNTKCRLYERDTFSSKWRDMGGARLTIMLPDPSSVSNMRQGKGSPGTRDPSQEKRIVVRGKKMDETLLDVTLNESCFERIARLGIAVSVWEDIVGPDGELVGAPKTGGVGGARARVFMIQMKSERECAYSFSLLGKNRY